MSLVHVVAANWNLRTQLNVRQPERHRDFIKVDAASAVTWPVGARAQRPTLPVVGFVNLASAKGGYAQNLSAFLKGLSLFRFF
jgi:hypothetical protein